MGLLAVAFALVIAAIRGAGAGGGAEPVNNAARASTPHPQMRAQARRSIRAALVRGVREAGRLGGTVEAAVMLGPWKTPVLAASARQDTSRSTRMWSMSKVLTLVALLREEGWGEVPGMPLSSEVSAALRAAIGRSENCPARRVVLELQEVVGGSAGAAREAMEGVLQAAGARAEISSEAAPPDPSCIAYLENQQDIDDPLGSALLAGVSTWSVEDAVRFSHALATGVYGLAVTRRVLGLMRLPKKRSEVVQPSEYTPRLDWGAGHALRDLNPAYKPGWGGVQQGEFMAGQVVIVDRPGGGRAALAVMFHPDAQPPIDDPGQTAAPLGLEVVMESVARALR